jgi:hypothetical protein
MVKSKLESHIEDDLAVKRETIIKLFDPPPGKTTFHEWVNKGAIVKARNLKGYYLLNATPVRLGMNPIPMKDLRDRMEVNLPSTITH